MNSRYPDSAYWKGFPENVGIKIDQLAEREKKTCVVRCECPPGVGVCCIVYLPRDVRCAMSPRPCLQNIGRQAGRTLTPGLQCADSTRLVVAGRDIFILYQPH